MELNKKKININSQIKINFVKNSHIIYPISKNKYKNTNSEYLNFFNKHNSNRFISNKIINKIKLKNSSISLDRRNKNSYLKINNKNNFYYKNYNNNNSYNHRNINNNKKILLKIKKIDTQIYKEEKKNVNIYNNKTNKAMINDENIKIYINKKDYLSYKEILNLWDKLYIPLSYRNIFRALLNQLEKEDKTKLVSNEFIELEGLIKEIDTLLNNIKSRKEIINKMKEINNNLKLIFKSDEKESNKLLVKNMSNYIEKMRIITINICFLMKKIKKKIYNGSMTAKYNIDLISQSFNFDKNYLIKMKEELDFLKEGNAKYFFNISEEKDPFLIRASNNDENSKKDPFIYIVPITEEIRTKIEKCNYIIYQELIAYQNRDLSNNIFRPISPSNKYFSDLNIPIKSDNRMNINNLYLKKSKVGLERLIPQKESELKFIHCERKSTYKNTFLKSNSCMNFQIKSTQFSNKTFFLTNLEKINNQ
jgi:hypothetical protein